MKSIGFHHFPALRIGSRMERSLLLWAVFHLGYSIGPAPCPWTSSRERWQWSSCILKSCGWTERQLPFCELLFCVSDITCKLVIFNLILTSQRDSSCQCLNFADKETEALCAHVSSVTVWPQTGPEFKPRIFRQKCTLISPYHAASEGRVCCPNWNLAKVLMFIG